MVRPNNGHAENNSDAKHESAARCLYDAKAASQKGDLQ